MSNENKKNFILIVIFIILLALLALTGCAKIEIDPPQPRPDAPQGPRPAVPYERLPSHTWRDHAPNRLLYRARHEDA